MVSAQLRELSEPPAEEPLPVLPVLGGVLPGGGLRRGCVVAVERSGLLCVTLAAGASAAGAWCAVVGMPQFGVLAAADAGLDVSRLLLVPAPGPRWPQVVAALLEGCELVLLSPPTRPSPQVARRLVAHARRSGGALVVAGDWTGAHLRLRLTRSKWVGVGAGHGRLRGRRVRVVASGRGSGARPRADWWWLPGPDGGVAAVERDMAARAEWDCPARAERGRAERGRGASAERGRGERGRGASAERAVPGMDLAVCGQK